MRNRHINTAYIQYLNAQPYLRAKFATDSTCSSTASTNMTKYSHIDSVITTSEKVRGQEAKANGRNSFQHNTISESCALH